MPIHIYSTSQSVPCRAVLATCTLGKIDVVRKPVDMAKGEHFGPEFTKINPEQRLPAMDDDGFLLWESRAMMCYLCDKYSKNPDLYPKDLKDRAKVNRFLMYDVEQVFTNFTDYVYPSLFSGEAPGSDEKVKKVLDRLDGYLEGQDYFTGKKLTIADISIGSSLMFLEVLDYDMTKWKNLTRFVDSKIKTLPFNKEWEAGTNFFKQWMAGVKKSKQGKK